MRQMQQGKSKAEANKLSVALELQVDFMRGFEYIQNMKDFLKTVISRKLTALLMLLATMLFNLKCKDILF
jgi:predicted metalloprotease